jgi:hypothetical protein
MNSFKQFNVKAPSKGFEGDKIKMSKILNREIVVHDFKLEPSKVFGDRGSGKCLHLQISFNNEMHIIFTGAGGLIDMIEQVPKSGFPFSTTIVQEGDRFLFT